MKKTIFLAAFLFLIMGLVSGCGNKNQIFNNSESNQPEAFVGSLNDLLNRGEAVKCSYSKEDDQGKYNGIFYVDGRNQKVRSEVEMTLKTGTTTKIMAYGIMDKEYSYSWTNLMPNKGYKVKLVDTKAVKTDKPDQAQKVDWEEKNNFSCSHWNLDESFFVLPTGVDFQDINSIIPKVNTSTASTTKTTDVCGLCAQIPEASAKAQCEQSCK